MQQAPQNGETIGTADKRPFGIFAEKLAGYIGFPVPSAVRQIAVPNAKPPAAATWMLQCLIHCPQGNRGAGLRDIIAFGDFINHAIFTHSEFCAALDFLCAAHICFVHGGRIFLTKSFRQTLRSFWVEREIPAYAKEYKELEKFLYSVRPAKKPARIYFSQKIFSEAVALYLDSADAGRSSKK